MIKKIVNQWFENKNKLESYFKETPQSEYSSYEDIVKKIIELVLNQGENSLDLDISRMTAIDDGDYQGTQIYIIPVKVYQPWPEDYYWTHNHYGSCSGCDQLLGISQYSDGMPNEEQVKDYMYLSLQIIQKFKSLTSPELNLETEESLENDLKSYY